MLRFLLIITFTVQAIFASGQLSNPGFESWTLLSDFDHPVVNGNSFISSNLETFYDFGILSCTEVAGVQGSAMRIETVETASQDTIIGYGIWGAPPAGEELLFEEGFSVTDQEITGISCDLRYEIDPSSSGFVIVQFKFQGAPAGAGNFGEGTYFFPVSGSQETFQNQTFTLNPGIGALIDECIIGFACNNLLNENTEPVPGNFLEVDNVTFTGSEDIVPGGNLNEWTPFTPLLVPDGWVTSANPMVPFVEQSEDAAEGSFAMQLRTLEFDGDVTAAIATQGIQPGSEFTPAQELPEGFYGWSFQYKYLTENTDTAAVLIAMSEDPNPDPENTVFHFEPLLADAAFSEVTIDFTALTEQLDLNYFAIAIVSSWEDNGIPDGNVPQVNSTLLVDDFQELILGDDPCIFDVAIEQGNEVILCPGESSALSVPDDYDAYQWYREPTFGGGAEELSGEITSLLSIDVENFALYNVWCEVTLDECTEASAPTVIDSYVFVPTTIASNVTEACAPETVTLEALGAEGEVTWLQNGFEITGENSNPIEIDETGSYVAVIYPELCPNYGISSGLGVGVTIFPEPEPELIFQNGQISIENGPFDEISWLLNGISYSNGEFDGQSEITPNTDGAFTVEVLDPNGCEAVSDPFMFTGVSELRTTVTLAPNPTMRFLEVQSNVPGTCELRDISGRLVSAKALDAMSHHFDLIDVARGVYLLQMHGRTYRVIKQ